MHNKHGNITQGYGGKFMRNVNLVDHLEKLVYVAAVANAGSFSAAAKILHLSQPALSRAVKTVETILGVPIFVRQRDGIVPTKAGRDLLATTAEMMRLFHDAETRVRMDAAVAMQTLTLGTKEPFAIHVWPQYVGWLQGQVADEALRYAVNSIHLNIEKLNSRLWDQMKSRKLDFTLLAEPAYASNIASTLLFYSEIRLYRAGPAGRKKFGSPLTDECKPLLCYRDAIIKRDASLGVLIGKAKLTRRVVDVQSFDAARAMTVRGLGYCLLPHWIAYESQKEHLLENVPLASLGSPIKIPRSGVYLSGPDNGPANALRQRLVTTLKVYCQSVFG